MFGNRSVIKTAKKPDLILTAKNYSEFLQTFNTLLQRRGSTILNKQVNFLTTQYIGTCKSAYTKGNALNRALTKGK